MREYKAKMERYRLPFERYRYLRHYCMTHGRCRTVIKAARSVTDEVMAEWIILHVTTSDWKWKRLYISGIPCSADTFRIYRARFYHALSDLIGAEKT